MLADHLFIADTIAASLIFDPSMTAKDRALMLAISWYAGQHPDEIEDDLILVPDLPLRRALGDMRRPDEVWEEARYRRLEHATARSDETVPDLAEGVLVPTVPQGVRRVFEKGSRRWIVEPGIVRSFTPYTGDTTVGVPLVILAQARSRFSLQLTLRVLAWGSGNHPSTWLRRRNDGHRVLRVPFAAMMTEMGLDPKSKPADALRHDLKPAVDEIGQLSDLIVELQPYYAPSIRAPRGRMLGFDILVGDVETNVVPAAMPPAQIIPMKGFQGWIPPGSDETDEDIAF